MTHITQAPFETFAAHADRSELESPYNETFIAECRRKALEYDKEDVFLRGSLLSSLQPAIPMHYRGKVFEGISFVFVK
jgi:hypothetical protein